MKRFLKCLLLACLILPFGREARAVFPEFPLQAVPFEQVANQVLFDQEIWQRKADLLKGTEDNLAFLESARAEQAYAQFRETGVSKTLVERSLRRFRYLLLNSSTAEELRGHLIEEFMFYRPTGLDGQGTVRFTGYFQPVYQASRQRTGEYRYPIYRLPENFERWNKPHPTRVFLEGYDGLGNPQSPLYGHELAWFKTRYEAFMIHVQGSAMLEFTDGTQQPVGFAAGTEYPFRGIGKKFLKEKGISWSALPEYFTAHPSDLNFCLARNNRFIFFRENSTTQPTGSLGVPVRPESSMATDKSILPPAALGLIRTNIPHLTASGAIRLQKASRLVLDQDTGSAIKGPGRVDLFMGTGPLAQRKANYVFADGQLYYLFLK